MTTNARLTRIGFAVVLSITVSLATGCKSGGSKWAWWNPMSRSAADTSLVARTAPALPSDAATPLIEGVTPPAVTAVASTTAPSATPAAPAFTPPPIPKTTIAPAGSIASSTPAQEAAKLATTPQITSPAAQPYMAPTKTMTPANAYAASGPYNPNAYQPSTPAQTANSAPSDSGRYGGLGKGDLGNRYASVASNVVAEAVPDFSKTSAPAAVPATPDRYGMGGRYASAPVAAAPVTPAPTTPAPVAPAATLATTTPPPVTPVASPVPPHPTQSGTPAVVGTLPATSVYSTASAVPTTVPASGRSEIRLTSLPGEYRPGGTGTYKSGVSIATRPDTSAPVTTPPATTPRYR